MASSSQETVIEAGRTERHYWRDLWTYRELSVFLAWRDILVHDRVTVFRTEYATPDGTCIRDYIHVKDLERAHLDALACADGGVASDTFIYGYGRGFSVRQVLIAVQKASGARLPIEHVPRRPGDPPKLVAESSRIRNVLSWKPKHENLDVICSSA